MNQINYIRTTYYYNFIVFDLEVVNCRIVWIKRYIKTTILDSNLSKMRFSYTEVIIRRVKKSFFQHFQCSLVPINFKRNAYCSIFKGLFLYIPVFSKIYTFNNGFLPQLTKLSNKVFVY